MVNNEKMFQNSQFTIFFIYVLFFLLFIVFYLLFIIHCIWFIYIYLPIFVVNSLER